MLNASVRIQTTTSYVLFFFAVIFLFVFGIVGFLKPNGAFGTDFFVLYDAGKTYLNGGNPYLIAADASPFAYPPHILPFLAFYALFSPDIAILLHTILNIISIIIIAYLANSWFIKIKDLSAISLTQGICVAIFFGNPFMVHSVFLGQVSLPICASILLSWNYLSKNKKIISGIFLCLATIKPTLSIIYILYLILSFNIYILFAGAFFAFFLLVPEFIEYGFLDIFNNWFNAILGYSGHAENALGSLHVITFENLLSGYNITGAKFYLVAIGLSIATWHFIKNKGDAIMTSQLFFVIPLLFIYGHTDDLSTTILLWSYALFLTLNLNDKKPFIYTFLLLMVFFLPQRLVRGYEDPLLHHLPSISLFICWLLTYRWRRLLDEQS